MTGVSPAVDACPTTCTVGTPLTQEDLASLERSYISPDLAARAGLTRVDKAEGSRLMGRKNDSADNAGIVFPYKWPGESVSAYRLRRDHPPQKQTSDGDLKVDGKYLSKAGQPGILYVGPGTTQEMLGDLKLPIVITEGEKKCLALHRVAEDNAVKGKPMFMALGLPGVYNWLSHNESEPGDSKRGSRPIKRLNDVLWQKREVTILFDANAETNANVATAQDRLARELKTRGAKVKIGRVPPVPGVNGIDDLLGIEGPEKLLREILPGALTWKATTNLSAVTDADNAERLVSVFGSEIRFISDAQIWAVWNDSQWKIGPEAKSLVMQKALETAKKVDTASAHKVKSRAKLENMVALAQHDPAIRVEHASFDADHYLLNVANGTVDLRTGKLRQHCKEDLLSKKSPIEFDPKASCPNFEKFLREVFARDPDVIPFLKSAIGYSLTGCINEHVVFFLHGSGRNGKGTLINIIQHVMGPGYSHAANIATFMRSKDSGQGPNEGVTALCGNRFVSAQEPNENRRYDVALLKMLTGGDKITAHRKFEHQFTFDPTHKLWIATNPPPVIPPDDPAIWARVKLIPFKVSFQGHENTGLLDLLKEEASGILNWMIEGALDWYQHGLGTCAPVEVATLALRDENDQVAQFIADCCEVAEEYWITPQELYVGYKNWAFVNGRKSLSLPKFMGRLNARGVPKVTVQGKLRRKGLRLKEIESYPLPPLKLVYTQTEVPRWGTPLVDPLNGITAVESVVT